MIEEEATLGGFGTVHFNEEAMANIIALKDLREEGKVTYDGDQEDAFCVQDIKFAANEQGLYVYKPEPIFLNDVKKENGHSAGVCLAGKKKQTEKAIERGFTNKQIERAKKVREFYHVGGAPTFRNLKMILHQNLFQKYPVTVEDVNLAEKIFEPNMSTLKGRSTRPKSLVVANNYIEISTTVISQQS